MMDVAHIKPCLPIIELMEGNKKGQRKKDDDNGSLIHGSPSESRKFPELIVLINGIKLLCEVTSWYLNERGRKGEDVKQRDWCHESQSLDR
jgi:hypothetical protein